MNKTWHTKNILGNKPDLAQRLAWHFEHQKNCACRPMPLDLQQEIAKVGSAQFHVTAGCFLTRKDATGYELLLIYKKWSDDNQGWVLPKGHVEGEESLAEAAQRETIEETGYANFKILRPLKTLDVEYPWLDGKKHRKIIQWYHAELLDAQHDQPQLTPEEKQTMTKIEWFNLVEALQVMKFADEKEILQDLIAELKQN